MTKKTKTYASFADVHDLARPLDGASVTNLDKLFDDCVAYYTREKLWCIPDDATELIWFIYFDCRHVWANNMLIGWGPKQVSHPHSPSNILPLLMAKWEGNESYDKLFVHDLQLKLTAWATAHDGKIININGRNLVIRCPIIVDWVAQLAVLNNCAVPSAQVCKDGRDPIVCGLCGFRVSCKCGEWREDPLHVWRRISDVHPLWSQHPHLFGATPSKTI